jgi:GntR family transcriptional regulator/MocR family aminotransferase
VWSRIAARQMARISAPRLDYSELGGLRSLRAAVAEHVRVSRGARCDADQVVIVAGAQRGLDVVCRLLLDPGDLAAIEDPGYPGARHALAAAGAEVVPVPVDAEGLDARQLARRGPRVRLVFVTPSHQFPLGVPMSLRRRLALLRWASATGAWVVEDDYDSEFRYGERALPCLHGLDSDGRVIYLGSFSKAVFPALRLGFLILPKDLVERTASARWTELLPWLDQAVLAEFIREGHFARHLRRMRSLYRERLEALESSARRHCQGALHLRPVRTGLHAVADLEDADAAEVYDHALARGVEVMPVSEYYMDEGRAPQALMLGFGAVPPEAVERGMQDLAVAIEAARSRGKARSGASRPG